MTSDTVVFGLSTLGEVGIGVVLGVVIYFALLFIVGAFYHAE